MGILIIQAAPDDAEIIVNARITLLDEASDPLTEEEKSNLYISNRTYIQERLRNSSLISIIAFEGSIFIGTCSLTLYQVMPGRKLPDGKQAYLQNMYIVLYTG